MVIQSPSNPSLMTGPAGKPVKPLIRALDILCKLNPRLRRCVRDLPPSKRRAIPTTTREGDILALLENGLLARAGKSFFLTSLGEIAQSEICQAEQYFATH